MSYPAVYESQLDGPSSGAASGLRVALVHDWLVGWGGAESVLESLGELFPEAPIFTLIWDPSERVRSVFGHRDVRTTVLQKIPGSGRHYRYLLPFMPAAFTGLDLTEYDLVISSSHAFSKAVRTRSSAVHICYCHTPPRYLWDLQGLYNPGIRGRIRGPVIRWLRARDREVASRVDRFLANSQTVRDRIRRNYGREAQVIYPAVSLREIQPTDRRPEDYFVAGGRLVRYKRVDLAIRAANRLGVKLKVFGDGPQRAELERLAGPTVEMLGRVSNKELATLLGDARAFVFPGVEDFGILPVEAQGAGRPVIARGEGGATETVEHGVTGLLWGTDSETRHEIAGDERDLEDVLTLANAMERALERDWNPDACRANAERFSVERFQTAVLNTCSQALGRKVTTPTLQTADLETSTAFQR